MEEGLKTADPHDFSTYTGWTGEYQAVKLMSFMDFIYTQNRVYIGVLLIFCLQKKLEKRTFF